MSGRSGVPRRIANQLPVVWGFFLHNNNSHTTQQRWFDANWQVSHLSLRQWVVV